MTLCVTKFGFSLDFGVYHDILHKKFGSSLDFGLNYDLLQKQNLSFLTILAYNTTFCVTKFAISLDF